jgi:hypothetical protein
MKKIDITDFIGTKHNRLTILKEVEPILYKKGAARRVLCKCDCGKEKFIDFNSIRTSKSKSFGCLSKETSTKLHTKHGLAMLSTGVRHPDYCIWMKMKSRCLNPNDKSYKNYGGRGIKVCEAWQESFTSFIDDMGWRPNNKYSIERIDYNKDYCPENCKWILKSEQTKNCRRVKLIAYNGKEHCLTDLCKLLGLVYSTMRHRVYDLGIPFEEAAKYPQHYKFKKEKHTKGLCGSIINV